MITLKKHFGKHIITHELIEHDQYQIFYGKKFIGIVNEKPGSTVCFIKKVTKTTEKAVFAEVEKVIGVKPEKAHHVLVLQDAPEENY
ncbi:MAG TPA: hypothetical protein VGN57_10050 [Pirellulaceae bacterium]|jgi:hypothetical protein|nr:hypothetical protein [Pirellulaceae bacterium]